MQLQKGAVAKPTLVYDIEVYRDYFLIAFLNVDTGGIRHFEMFEGQPLDVATIRAILKRYRLVSFNGNNFDLPLVTLALGGADCAKIKSVSDRIIVHNIRPWAMGIESVKCDHIDLIEVSPGFSSLKIYGGRLHCQKMQDLPIEPSESIAPEMRTVLRQYCENDLHTTQALYEKLLPQIELRERMGVQYGIDLRSKSDAQIAEAVIRLEVEKSLNRKLKKVGDLSGTEFKYCAPEFVEFETPFMRSVLDTVLGATFVVMGNGQVRMPEEIAKLKIRIGQSDYKMGIGGLHSMEKCEAHVADDETILVDRDVASYYPAIILNCGLKPAQMGEHFTHVYRSIVERRLKAKREGDSVVSDALKITINGSFGKFGSPYSILYSPTLLIQTTVTGQLSLLMLIEALESEGIAVVSANTDGIVIKCPVQKSNMLEFVVWEWEAKTGFVTEESRYRALYSRDVNNYIAITDKGYKAKGAYTPAALQKNPTNEICSRAVVRYLQTGKPVEDTIRECDDIRMFVNIRTVKGGALKGEEYLGKAVRWYYAQGETGTINYKVNGYTVPRSEGARPLMELPDSLPKDIDYDWYVREAYSILKSIGVQSA